MQAHHLATSNVVRSGLVHIALALLIHDHAARQRALDKHGSGTIFIAQANRGRPPGTVHEFKSGSDALGGSDGISGVVALRATPERRGGALGLQICFAHGLVSFKAACTENDPTLGANSLALTRVVDARANHSVALGDELFQGHAQFERHVSCVEPSAQLPQERVAGGQTPVPSRAVALRQVEIVAGHDLEGIPQPSGALGDNWSCFADRPVHPAEGLSCQMHGLERCVIALELAGVDWKWFVGSVLFRTWQIHVIVGVLHRAKPCTALVFEEVQHLC